MTIRLIEDLRELVRICAELAREGVRFNATKDDVTKTWTVTLTGGF